MCGLTSDSNHVRAFGSDVGPLAGCGARQGEPSVRREEQLQRIARDCVHFRHDQPCGPHRREGATCRCAAYTPCDGKALIVQLSSPAAVVQSSAVVHRLKADHPNRQITFLTDYPELLGAAVDIPMRLDAGTVQVLQMDRFDAVYNLDMDRRACAVANLINAPVKKGFYLRDGQCMPVDRDSQAGYLRAILPGSWGDNPPNVVKELFQSCGLEYRLEKPRLVGRGEFSSGLCKEDVAVGLFTTWEDRKQGREQWPEGHWTFLAEHLGYYGVTPVLLADAKVEALNRRIAAKTPALYEGPLGWGQMLDAIERCEVVVSAAAVGVSLGVSLRKQVVHIQAGGSAPDVCLGFGVALRPEGHTELAGDLLPDKVLEAVLGQIEDSAEKDKRVKVGGGSTEESAQFDAARQDTARTRHRP